MFRDYQMEEVTVTVADLIDSDQVYYALGTVPEHTHPDDWDIWAMATSTQLDTIVAFSDEWDLVLWTGAALLRLAKS